MSMAAIKKKTFVPFIGKFNSWKTLYKVYNHENIKIMHIVVEIGNDFVARTP